mgnify:CR=1 FL=1
MVQSGPSPAAAPAIPEHVSKADFAHSWLEQRIRSQEYAPGHRLVLAGIASSLGMSVVPVREAIRRLEAQGLVTFQRNVGAQVAMIEPDEYRSTMEVLGLLEGKATAVSAARLGPRELERARSINQEMEALADDLDPALFTELNHEFHRTLTCRCDNVRLSALVEAEWVRLGQLRMSTFAFIPGRARESVQEHARILGLIEARASSDEIERACRAHRLATVTSYLRSQSAG